MAKVCALFISSFLVFVVLCALSGCHNNPDAVGSVPLKDEKAMQRMLRGSWILKEYEDSIDAGLTPKLLEYMMQKINHIRYAPGPNGLVIKGVFQTGDRNGFWDIDRSVDACSVVFMPAIGKLIFHITEHLGSTKSMVDTAEFVFNGMDTVLRVYQDSEVIDFIKYDVGQCREMTEYDHLANSKFIAGKYYLDSDTGRLHHIIFTRCGGIEGAEYIHQDLIKYKRYNAGLPFNLTDTDELSLYDDSDPRLKYSKWGEVGVAVFRWEVVEDSLILTPDRGHERIVLVKAP